MPNRRFKHKLYTYSQKIEKTGKANLFEYVNSEVLILRYHSFCDDQSIGELRLNQQRLERSHVMREAVFYNYLESTTREGNGCCRVRALHTMKGAPHCTGRLHEEN